MKPNLGKTSVPDVRVMNPKILFYGASVTSVSSHRKPLVVRLRLSDRVPARPQHPAIEMCSTESAAHPEFFEGLGRALTGSGFATIMLFHGCRAPSHPAANSGREPSHSAESTSCINRRAHGRNPAFCNVAREATLEAPQRAAGLLPVS